MYHIEIDEFRERYDKALSGFPENVRSRILKRKNEDARLLSAAAWSLAFRGLQDVPNPQIDFSATGKPFVSNAAGIYFSLSHSGSVAMCAVSSCEIGCDIERIRNISPNIAKRFFSPSENALLDSSPVEKFLETFFTIWTRKESYVKCTGEGLRINLAEIDASGEKFNGYEFHTALLKPDYIYSVCTPTLPHSTHKAQPFFGANSQLDNSCYNKTMIARKMPIGVQDFEKLIKEKFVYVDKTAFAYNLAKNSTVVFLSRPRRFGKSLFLSTLKQYFLGNKDLFKGLAIEKLEEEEPTAFDGVAWAKHPVIYIDLNSENFEDKKSLQLLINRNLEPYEKEYGLVAGEETLAGRFSKLVRAAAEKSGRKAVVLVDEYDKPLLQTIGNEKLFDEYRAMLKGFYGVLKSEDAYLRFSMLTGVTKFSKVSVWSDLNNLQDISMSPRYANICGITQAELHEVFDDSVQELAAANGMTKDECYAELKQRYDGNHFTFNSEGIYNPFSMLNTFENTIFSDYWFQTGTPTFLVEEIKRNNFDLRKIIDGIDVEANKLSEHSLGGTNPIPILMQSGYLTIKGYDKEFDIYHLELPNEEVKYGFMNLISQIEKKELDE